MMEEVCIVILHRDEDADLDRSLRSVADIPGTRIVLHTRTHKRSQSQTDLLAKHVVLPGGELSNGEVSVDDLMADQRERWILWMESNEWADENHVACLDMILKTPNVNAFLVQCTDNGVDGPNSYSYQLRLYHRSLPQAVGLKIDQSLRPVVSHHQAYGYPRICFNLQRDTISVAPQESFTSVETWGTRSAEIRESTPPLALNPGTVRQEIQGFVVDFVPIIMDFLNGGTLYMRYTCTAKDLMLAAQCYFRGFPGLGSKLTQTYKAMGEMKLYTKAVYQTLMSAQNGDINFYFPFDLSIVENRALQEYIVLHEKDRRQKRLLQNARDSLDIPPLHARPFFTTELARESLWIDLNTFQRMALDITRAGFRPINYPLDRLKKAMSRGDLGWKSCEWWSAPLRLEILRQEAPLFCGKLLESFDRVTGVSPQQALGDHYPCFQVMPCPLLNLRVSRGLANYIGKKPFTIRRRVESRYVEFMLD